MRTGPDPREDDGLFLSRLALLVALAFVAGRVIAWMTWGGR